MLNSKIIATGAYLPSKVLRNEDLPDSLETSDEWITARTGIKQRHLVADGEYASDLAAKALMNCLKEKNLPIHCLDGIIVATTTPDVVFPSTAALVQKKIGLSNCAMAFDINAVCTGFVYALAIADSMIKNGICKRIAVIGAETMSKILDWNDRSTCVLFGDGAGVFILEASTQGESKIIASELYANGVQSDALTVGSGVGTGELKGKLKMKGLEVFKFAVDKMSSTSESLLVKNGFKTEDIDWLLLHQANMRIIESVAEKLKIPNEKAVCTIDMHANTSAASIPLAFNHYYKNGKIKEGNLIVISAAGAGLTWGGLLIRV